MKIGIIGLSVVGNAMYVYYEREHEVYAYDVLPERSRCSLDELNSNAEVVFIAVPTPYSGDGLDCSAVYDAVSRLTGKKTIIIKSTVMPGTTDDLQEKYPQHRFFFVPEFLSEATAVTDYANPRREHVVGVVHKDWWEAERCGARYGWNDLIDLLMPGKLRSRYMPAKQAELLKLATNAFYALKVIFANMLYDIGMTQETLDALAADPWIAPSHFQVMHKGYRGFGGAGLVKDTYALCDYAEGERPPSDDMDEEYADELLRVVLGINERLIDTREVEKNEVAILHEVRW